MSAGLFYYMAFCVYILYSDLTGKYYAGQTEDMNERLKLHNPGAFVGSFNQSWNTLDDLSHN
jgi:predicted GIY-YIG superfamily endonuclease